MSVMISPSGRSSNDWGHGRSSRYKTPQETTQTIRNWSAFGSIVSVVFTVSLAGQFIALVLASAGSAAFILLVGSVAVGSIVATVILFRSEILEGRRASALVLPVPILLLSFLVPGLPAVIAVVLVVGEWIYVIYVSASRFIQTRVFALIVTALPVIGGLYYVPRAIGDAGLVVTTNAPAETTLAPALTGIGQALQKTYSDGVTLSYQIRGNRLYADISKNGTVESMPLASDDLVRTPVRWLERRLSRELTASLSAGANGVEGAGYQRVSEILSPVASTLGETNTVLVVDGELMNFPHQTLLPAKRVFRSVSLDTEKIGRNLADWANSPMLQPGQVVVLNGLPQSAEELQRLDMPGEAWDQWQSLHQRFEEAIPPQILPVTESTSATKVAFLDSLQHKPALVMIVAHSDGYSIWLPNGERVDAKDIAAVGEAIRSNRPRVFLFSCETARLDDVQSFAKVLLDHGATAVAAPVTRLPVEEALEVFQSFMGSAVREIPVRINEAFEDALQITRRSLMEIWVAEVEPRVGDSRLA